MPQIDQLVRCQRRSLAIIITDDAKLVVRAPHRLPEDQVHRFVGQKTAWIERKMKEVLGRPKPRIMTEAEKLVWREMAGKTVAERVEHYGGLTGLRPRSVRISNARKRWGSCGAKGAINISWRLVLAPLEVLDYVIVHELVHLAEKNHSKRFWLKVENILPDYRRARKWLRDNGRMIS